MPFPDDPIAARAGLHPNWRKLHLAHIRQTRAFMRAPWNRHRRFDYRRALRAAQTQALRARRLYNAARGVMVCGRAFEPHVVYGADAANRFMARNPGYGLLHVGRGEIHYLARMDDAGRPIAAAL